MSVMDQSPRDKAILALHFEKRHLLADIAVALRHGDSTERLQAELRMLREQYSALCLMADDRDPRASH